MQEKDNPSIESGKGSSKKVLLVIGVVVAVVLCVTIPLLLTRGSSGPTPLEIVQGKVSGIEMNLASIILKVAEHTEDLADLGNEVEATTDWTAAIQSLQVGLQNVTARLDALPNWSGNLTTLSNQINTLNATLVALNLTGIWEVIEDILTALSACNCTVNSTG